MLASQIDASSFPASSLWVSRLRSLELLILNPQNYDFNGKENAQDLNYRSFARLLPVLTCCDFKESRQVLVKSSAIKMWGY